MEAAQKAVAKMEQGAEDIVLRSLFIGDDGACLVARALARSTSVQSVDLSWNRIGPRGAAALSLALLENESITVLNLSNNSIGDEGAAAVGRALEANTALLNVNLAENKVGDDGAKALAAAFVTNTTCEDLNLAHNAVGDEGARAFVEALATNPSLVQVVMWSNPSLSAEASKAVSKAADDNAQLVQRALAELDGGLDAVLAGMASPEARGRPHPSLLAWLEGKGVPSEDVPEDVLEAARLCARVVADSDDVAPARLDRLLLRMARLLVAPLDGYWAIRASVGHRGSVTSALCRARRKPAEQEKGAGGLPPRNMWLRLPDDVVKRIATQMQGHLLLFTHPRFVRLAEQSVANEVDASPARAQALVMLCAAAHM